MRFIFTARRERPRSRTADETDELTPLHLRCPMPMTEPNITPAPAEIAQALLS
jgi:hypothetical protein